MRCSSNRPRRCAWAAGLAGLLAWPGLLAAAASAPAFHSSLAAATSAAAHERGLILAVFGATWCEPCRTLEQGALRSPEFAAQGGPLQVAQVDVEADEADARAFAIRAVPTLVLLTPDHTLVSRRQGGVDAAGLIEWVQEGRERVAHGLWEGIAPDRSLKELAARVADEGLGPAQLTALVARLGETDPAVRAGAAELLRTRPEAAVPALIQALGDPYLGARVGAADVLRKLCPGAPEVDPWRAPADLASVQAGLTQWWKTNAASGATAGPVALEPSIVHSLDAALEDVRTGNALQRTAAMSSLVRHGLAALPAVRRSLRQAERAADARTLGLLEDARWAILVPNSLEQTVTARRALARGASPERQAAAVRLGRGRLEAIPALAELVEDPDPLVIESAVRALSAIGGKDSVPALAVLLKASDSNIRMTAAQALGRTKSAAATAPLLGAVGDTNEVVACAALAALEELDPTGKLGSFLPSSDVVGTIGRVFGRPSADEVGEAFRRAFADPRWRVRATAAEVAGKLRTANLGAAMVPLLEDRDGFVVKNALVALGRLDDSPNSDELLALAQRQPTLRGDVVDLLMQKPTDAAIRSVTKLYESSDAGQRQAILGALARRRDTSSLDKADDAWKPLLEAGAHETDPRLRRLTAALLGRRSVKLASETVDTFLADADTETRSTAAAVALNLLGQSNGPTARLNLTLFVPPSSLTNAEAHGTADLAGYPGLSDFAFSRSASRKPSSAKPVVTPERVAAWHRILARDPALESDPAIAWAAYGTGDPRDGLAGLPASLRRLDGPGAARLSRARAVAAVVPKLPWPEGKEVLDELTRWPRLYVEAVTSAPAGAAGAADYLTEPARFRQALEPAQGEDLNQAVSLFLTPGRSAFSLRSAAGRPALLGLLESTNDVWRAAALFVLAQETEAANRSLFEQGLRDTSGKVRVAAVQGLARTLRDRGERERALGPLLDDAESDVRQMAGRALLEPEVRKAAGREGDLYLFHAAGVSQLIQVSGSDTSERPLVPLRDRDPGFLPSLRQRLATADNQEALGLALLLAQYGRFEGIDRLVTKSTQSGGEVSEEAQGELLAGIALSGDAKYLPYLKRVAAGMTEDYELRKILAALRSMPGAEARQFRLEINRRFRR